LSSARVDITTAHPWAVAAGMRTTFAVAAIVILMALAIASTTNEWQAEHRPSSGHAGFGHH
jgi:anti-sigma-K factor RskA